MRPGGAARHPAPAHARPLRLDHRRRRHHLPARARRRLQRRGPRHRRTRRRGHGLHAGLFPLPDRTGQPIPRAAQRAARRSHVHQRRPADDPLRAGYGRGRPRHHAQDAAAHSVQSAQPGGPRLLEAGVGSPSRQVSRTRHDHLLGRDPLRPVVGRNRNTSPSPASTRRSREAPSR